MLMLGHRLSRAFWATIRLWNIIPARRKIFLGITIIFLFFSALHYVSAKMEDVRPVRCGNRIFFQTDRLPEINFVRYAIVIEKSETGYGAYVPTCPGV